MKTLKQVAITAVMLAFTASAMAASNGGLPWPTPSQSPPSPPPTTPTPTPPLFYLDYHPDYLLQNASTRQTAIWYLNNNAYIGSAWGPTLYSGLSLAGVVFYLYGSADYYLFNPVINRTEIWSWSVSMPQQVGINYSSLLPYGWKLVDMADFTRDGQPDYVLLNATTRQTGIGNQWSGYIDIVGPTLPSGWVLVGESDFNRDGNRDYLLFNPTNRLTAIWYLSELTYFSYEVTVIGAVSGPPLPIGWTLVATADFNLDGWPDYVLYHAATRKTAIYYLKNNAYIGFAYGPTISIGWSFVTVTHPNQ